jgi:hypothetical protein
LKIFCLRIGNKYGPEYEDYINEKLKDSDVNWIREPFDKRVALQWNKIQCMALNLDEPIVVLDIDVILTGDYKALMDYPIQRGEFLSIPAWWGTREPWSINGGFQKYYPIDTHYIYDIFMERPAHWQKYYIKKRLTYGPVNGEQFFVEEHVKQKLKLKLVPKSWITRWSYNEETNAKVELIYHKKTGNEYIVKDDEWHPDLKLIHFTTSLNKPHEHKLWK